MDSTTNPSPTPNPATGPAPVQPQAPAASTSPASPLTTDSFQSTTSMNQVTPAPSSVIPPDATISPVTNPIASVLPESGPTVQTPSVPRPVTSASSASNPAMSTPSVSAPATPSSPISDSIATASPMLNSATPAPSSPNQATTVPRPVNIPNDLTFTAPRPATTQVEVPVPVHPVINPTKSSDIGVGTLGADGVSATDPILRSETTSASDSVEAELDAPMKAAAPVPGSIGSAISGPANLDNNQTSQNVDDVVAREEALINSVAFNDPADQVEQKDKPNSKPKKTNRVTLIALIVVAFMVVIALVAVLVLPLFGTPSNNAQTNTSEDSSIEESDDSSDAANGADSGVTSETTSVVCSVEGIVGAEEQGIESTTIVYKIVDNKLTGAEVDYVVVGENDSSNTVTEMLTLEDIFRDSEVVSDDFMEADGTLKVAPQAFADEMTRLVRESTSESLSCVVR